METGDGEYFEGVWFLSSGFPFGFEMNCSSRQPGARVARCVFFTFKLVAITILKVPKLTNGPEVTMSGLTSPRLSTQGSPESLY